MSLVADYGSGSESEEEVNVCKSSTNDEKTIKSQSISKKSIIGSLPPPKKISGPVKITLPSLPKADSDDEDEIVTSRKTPTIKAGTSLTAMLPAPKSATYTKIRSTSNSNVTTESVKKKPMIPYTLTKKARNQQSNSLRTDHKVSRDAKDDDDNDDGAPSAFFGNLNSDGKSDNATISISLSSGDIHSSENYKAKFENISTSQPLKSDSISNPVHPSRYYSAAYGTNQYQAAYYEPSNVYDTNQVDLQRDVPADNNYVGICEDRSQTTSTESSFMDTLKQDERFLRMQGKRKRGELDITNLIDVNEADHLVDAAQLRQKAATEEPSYRPQGDSKLKPSQLQRRKHQITYLAYQARERELELKNSWAASRATRKQTQSKYGF